MQSPPRIHKTRWLRIGLLAVAPLLAVAQVHYGRAVVWNIEVLRVDSNGERIIYFEEAWRYLRRPDSPNFQSTLVTRSILGSTRRTIRMLDDCDSFSLLSPDGSRLAASLSNAVFTVIDTVSGTPIQTKQFWSPPDKKHFTVGITPVGYSRNGRYLLVRGMAYDDKRYRGEDRRCLVLDAHTLTVTQDLGSWSEVDASVGDPHVVVWREGQSESPQKTNRDCLATFEEGKLLPIGVASSQRNSLHSANGRFAIESSSLGSITIRDLRSQTTRQLVIPLIFSHRRDFAPTGEVLLILMRDKVFRINLEAGIVDQVWQLGGERQGDPMFSPNGRLYAVPTDTGEIEIWDVESGSQRMKYSDAPRQWTLWAAAVLGSICWCAAWLASGRRPSRAAWSCVDIGIVSAVAASGFFLRLVHGGPATGHFRLSAIGTIVILVGLSVLLAVWLVFGAGRWSLRLPAAVAAFSLVWAGPVWVWHTFNLTRTEVPIASAATAAITILLLMLLRRLGYRLVCNNAEFASRAGAIVRGRLQMPLRDSLSLTAAIGLALLIAKFALTPDKYPMRLLGVEIAALVCAIQALMTTLAVWTALSVRGALVRVSVGLSGMLSLAIVVPMAFSGAALLPWWWFLGTQSAIGLYVYVCLLLLRNCGWRLTRTSTVGGRSYTWRGLE